MISSYFWGCPRSVELYSQKSSLPCSSEKTNKQINKQLSTSLGSLTFSKTLKRLVHTLTVFQVPKMQVRENGRQSGVFWKGRFILLVWTDENGGFRIQWCHKSYSACPVWYAFVFPIHCFSISVWTSENDFSKTEKHIRFLKYQYTCERDQI